MTLEAFVLGTGGSIPLHYRYLTSVLLRREGEVFLFDCGEATQMALRKINLKWKKISAIFVSHMHADHVTGLPGILMLSSQVERTDPLILIGVKGLKRYVENTLRDLEIHINYPIEFREIDDASASQIVYAEEDFKISAFPLRHTKTCVGYTFEESTRPGIFNPEACTKLGVPMGPLWGRLQKGDTVELTNGTKVTPEEVLGESRLGRKFCYVTDTAYAPNIAKEVQGADLLIMESMFLEKHKAEAPKKKHMTARGTAGVAKDAKVEALGLIHYSPRYTKPEVKEMGKEAKQVFERSFLTYDGQCIPIPYPEEGQVNVD